MPGCVMHLAVAEEIIRICNISDCAFINEFKIGSIIPDAHARDEKKITHFWDAKTYNNFQRKPNLNDFLTKYEDRLNEPYVFGYYAHLYFDREYMNKYWAKHFEFYDIYMNPSDVFEEVARVCVTDNNQVYSREEFFSDKLYYGDYDRMNSYVINRYGVKLPKLSKPQKDIDEITYEQAYTRLDEIDMHIKNIDSNSQAVNTLILSVKEIDELIIDTAKQLANVLLKMCTHMIDVGEM